MIRFYLRPRLWVVGMIAISILLMRPVIAKHWGSVEQEFLDQYPEVSNFGAPGFIVAISTPTNIPLMIAAGAADIEQQRKINKDTVFHIASLSKQITAAALAQAILSGKVSLDDPVLNWIPATDKYGDELTVKHLAYMTSGLTEYTDVARADGRPWTTFHYFSTPEAIRASLSVDHLLFKPGSQWRYSNINYMLISEIVSKAYGKPFSEVVKETVFAPLGMNSSLINDDVTQIIPNRANAYIERTTATLAELNSGAKVQVNQEGGLIMIRRNSPHYGGSGVMTSMNDWLKWQTELMTHKVFGEQFWQLMFATHEFDHDKRNDALGLVHDIVNSERTVWYEGADIDASSYSVTFLDQNINISCFSNAPLEPCRDKVLTIMHSLSTRLGF